MTWLFGSADQLWQTAAKAVLLFLVAVVGFRFGERRTFAELAPFDFVAVVGVGAIIGSTATSPNGAFAAGAVALLAVLATHRVVSRLRRRRGVATLVDQPVRLLIAEGVVSRVELRRAGLTVDDLYAVLRERGVQRLTDVRHLVYENKGAFSVISWNQPVDVEPVASAVHPDDTGEADDTGDARPPEAPPP